MANVGTNTQGKVLTARGVTTNSGFLDIGSLSGLTAHGVVIAEGNSAFTASTPGTAGQVLTSNGAALDPSFQAGGSTFATTYQTDSGTATPAAAILNELGSGSITTTGAGNTITTALTGLTDHAVLIGAGTSTITKVGPVASTGAVLMSNGLASDPGFSTATYPATTTVSQILYSSATNTVTGLATANRAVLTTGATGIPVLTALATDGQVIIGSTAGVPAAATLTAGSGVTITNASNSVTIAAVGSTAVGATNLGIAYSGGTFTVQGASAALSGTNIAYVTLQSKTAGLVKTIAITADQTFIDDAGASTIIGNLFGLTTGISAANDIPFFLYAVLNDAETAISFMISRYPNTKVSPVAAKIGKTGSAVADSQGSFFALGNPTVADYESNPCISLGSFRMTMSAADDWTVSALSISDGIGNYQENVTFALTVSQYGAASGKYFYDNGGTAPAFSGNANGYYIDRNNMFQLTTNFTNCTTAGVGAVVLQLALPFSLDGAALGAGVLINAAGLIFVCASAIQPTGPNNKGVLYVVDPSSALLLTNASVGLGASYAIDHSYRGFIVFS